MHGHRLCEAEGMRTSFLVLTFVIAACNKPDAAPSQSPASTSPPKAATTSNAPPNGAPPKPAPALDKKGASPVAKLLESLKKDKASVVDKKAKVEGYFKFGGGSVVNPDKSTTWQVDVAGAASADKRDLVCFTRYEPPKGLGSGDPIVVEGTLRGDADDPSLVDCVVARR